MIRLCDVCQDSINQPDKRKQIDVYHNVHMLIGGVTLPCYLLKVIHAHVKRIVMVDAICVVCVN